MKKADPFRGIPAVPNSLAGQWFAFEHMANHYRKLFNVKSRVDSNSKAPKTMQHSLSSYIKGGNLLSSKTSLRKQPSTTKSKEYMTHEVLRSLDYPDPEYSIHFDSVESSPRGALDQKSIKNKTNTRTLESQSNKSKSKYRLVYGPSSIKSSSDALVSDCDSQPEEPRVETMGVAEKIKVFLDQLHEFENPKKTKSKPKTTKNTRPQPKASEQKAPSLDARQSRHSRCFLPLQSPSESPKIVKKQTIDQTGNKKLAEAINKAKAMKGNGANPIGRIKSVMGTTSISTTTTNAKSRKQSENGESRVKQRNKEHYSFDDDGSVGSVGTIRGSDELTAEDLLILPLPHNLTKYKYTQDLELAEVQRSKIKSLKSSSRLSKSHKSKLVTTGIPRTRVSSAGYQSLSGKATSLSSLGVINNKDSSRDSAYGFSSGESRVTTRESTPEKLSTHLNVNKMKSKKSSDKNNNEKVKSKADLPTLESSVNIDACGDVVTKKEKRKHGSRSPPSEDKYLNFLTEVTEDIVTRGIYTNRGLKVLFKAHMDSHDGLDPHKMSDMLEKLRMDLGIPKDDTLNKLDFGYGSVVYKTDAYFYKNGKPNSNPNPTIPETYSSHLSNSPLNLNQSVGTSARPSRRNYDDVNTPTRIHQIQEDVHDYDDRFRIPVRERETRESNSDENGSELDLSSKSSKSESSLSESELRNGLKEVGINSETTLEIVGMIKHKSNYLNKSTKPLKAYTERVSSDDCFSDQRHDHSPPPTPTKSRTQSTPNNESRRHRSGSPPSRCSTSS